MFFERLKDEVRSGKSLRNSAQRGFAAAWHTIVIADLVSLIGAFVLWYLTVGAVRGFAFFLGLSTRATCWCRTSSPVPRCCCLLEPSGWSVAR